MRHIFVPSLKRGAGQMCITQTSHRSMHFNIGVTMEFTQDHRNSWKFLPIRIGSYVVLTKTAADLDGEISLRCSDHTVGTQSAHFQA